MAKDILMEQNKMHEIRNRLEKLEKDINARSEKEKQGNEELIGRQKKWTQIYGAIDHLKGFIDNFSNIPLSCRPRGRQEEAEGGSIGG